MRRRLQRVTGWFRRLHFWRFLVLLALVVLGWVAAWRFGGSAAAAFGGLAALGAGALLSRPLAVIWRRFFLHAAPWRNGSFGGEDLGFEVVGLARGESPVPLVDRIIGSGEQFDAADLFVEVWLVATDGSAMWQTVALEIIEPPAGRSVWTSSIDGWLTVADFDDRGRPSPFRAIHRLVGAEFDVPVVDIDLVVWGREETTTGSRSVVTAFVTTDATKLEQVDHGESLVDRRCHSVDLDPVGVADALGRAHSSHWRGGAVVGLLELLDRLHPGSWPEVERTVSARWREKAMFARIERGTQHVTGRALAVRR
jgi:hypothetical protein